MVTLSNAFPSKYLKAADLIDGPVIVTVRAAEQEVIKGFDGKEQSKVILYFAKKLKPLPLNRTNFEAMMDISGSDESDDWPGTRIELYVTKVTMPNGKPTDGIRLRKPNGAEKPKKVATPIVESPPVYDDEVPWR
jgi:hypothetical protein